MTIALETLTQRLSYIVGENMAHQLKNDGIELDKVALTTNDVFAGNPSRLSEADKISTADQV